MRKSSFLTPMTPMGAKLWNQVPSLDHFVVQNSGNFFCWKYKEVVCFMFQTWDNNQLLRRVLWINAELTIVWSLKHKNTQPSYIFNRENPQNFEPQNGPRRGLDFIALLWPNTSAFGRSSIITMPFYRLLGLQTTCCKFSVKNYSDFKYWPRSFICG